MIGRNKGIKPGEINMKRLLHNQAIDDAQTNVNWYTNRIKLALDCARQANELILQLGEWGPKNVELRTCVIKMEEAVAKLKRDRRVAISRVEGLKREARDVNE